MEKEFYCGMKLPESKHRTFGAIASQSGESRSSLLRLLALQCIAKSDAGMFKKPLITDRLVKAPQKSNRRKGTSI